MSLSTNTMKLTKNGNPTEKKSTTRLKIDMKNNKKSIKKSIHHFLVIINKSIWRENNKTRMDFNNTGEKDISYLFTDIINRDYFKFGIGLQE